jgi:hypothetical protein
MVSDPVVAPGGTTGSAEAAGATMPTMASPAAKNSPVARLRAPGRLGRLVFWTTLTFIPFLGIRRAPMP